jgi:hypothetical protein
MQHDEVAVVLEELVWCLVDRPEEAKVITIEASALTVLEVITAKSDYGKVVGQKGRTADALRELIVGISGAQRRPFTLTLVPPELAPPVSFSERRAVTRYLEDPVGCTERLLLGLIRLLVDDREGVRVESIEGQQAVIFEVGVAPEDMPRLIGQRGRKADSIRVILANLGARAGRRFGLEVLEPAS